MPRKLKAFTTTAGFFDLAIAAPSMKAALTAWGAESNLFHQGFARETRNAAIIEATMARPGVVLRRPVGTDKAFAETAEVSERALVGRAKKRTRKKKAEMPGHVVRNGTAVPRGHEAIRDFEKQEKLRADHERREEEAQERENARREKAVSAAASALQEAEAAHKLKVTAIERERAALDRKASAEERSWARKKDRLRRALRRARQ